MRPRQWLSTGITFTLSVDVAMNESMVAITSVTADLGGLDSTQTDPVKLDELSSSPGTYFTIITVSDDDDNINTAEDGEYTITITATDTHRQFTPKQTRIMVTLENDSSELNSARMDRAWDAPYKPGRNRLGLRQWAPKADRLRSNAVNDSESRVWRLAAN